MSDLRIVLSLIVLLVALFGSLVVGWWIGRRELRRTMEAAQVPREGQQRHPASTVAPPLALRPTSAQNAAFKGYVDSVASTRVMTEPEAANVGTRKPEFPSFGRPELIIYDPAKYEAPLFCCKHVGAMEPGRMFYEIPLFPEQGNGAMLAVCLSCYRSDTDDLA